MTDSEPATNITHVPLSLEEEQTSPRPRLCHLRKWPHFQGYGFNLHAERAKTGQHIGKVDSNSPAESAGLKEGDRIIEVNYVNISNENHQQVVKRIRNGLEKNGKFHDSEVVLLVVDNETDIYYKNLNMIVKSDFKNILKLKTPEKLTDDENNNENIFINRHSDNEQSNEKIMLTDTTNTVNDMMTGVGSSPKNQLTVNSMSSISQKSSNSIGVDSSAVDAFNTVPSQSITAPNSTNNNENLLNPSTSSMTNKSSNKDAASSTSNLSVSSNNQSNSSKATTPNIKSKNELNEYMSSDSNKANNVNTSLIYDQNSFDQRQNSNINQKNKVDPFQMSAAEFKTYLKSKGRSDPRVAQVDMRQKFQMFQDM